MVIRKLLKDNVTYWIGIPPYPVNLFVDYFMVCHGIPFFTKEYIFPNNHAEIFFNLGDLNYAEGNSKNAEFFFKETIVSGLRNCRLTIQPGKTFSLAGVRFNIFGFQNIFNIPSNEFTNRNFDATEVWDKNLLFVREQLMATAEPVIKIAYLDDWIKSKIQLHNLQDVKVWNKLSPLLKNTSRPLQPGLGALMGYSHKHIVKLFKEKCGLPPKMIQRIFRFNNVLVQASTSDLNLTALSHEAGYSDQSHFIKDFVQFTGFTPKIFLRQQPKDWLLLKESR